MVADFFAQRFQLLLDVFGGHREGL
jgi:hypothetical protein